MGDRFVIMDAQNVNSKEKSEMDEKEIRKKEHHDHWKEGHRPRVYPLNQNDLYSMMRYCGHYLYHRSGKGHGAGQERILSILAKRESMTQKELQSILQIQPGSMSEILAKMEEKNLISRRKDEEDKRKSIIELTETGRKTNAENDTRDGKDLFRVLSESEQEELKVILRKLTDNWK